MRTIVPRDDLHMSWRTIDGFNKAINVFISPREPGKTDTTWWEKIYSGWCDDNKPWGYLVRQVVEITEAILIDIENNINKWAVKPIQLQYNKGAFKDGIVDVKIDGKLFFRIIALSITLRRIKSAKIPNIKGLFMDEYIINPRTGEKYLPDEYFKIKELYTTYRREYQGKGMMKLYICGNPYSLFLPIFVGLRVDTLALRKDEYIDTGEEKLYEFPDGISFVDHVYKLKNHIYVGPEYAVEWGVLHPVLKRWLLEKNPFYQFDEEYNQYALEGCAVNDKNIKVGKLPPNYHLQFVIRIDNKNIGIFRNNYLDMLRDDYYCKELDIVSARRVSFCFDFQDMIDRTILVGMEERMMLQRFKDAFRKRAVSFENINIYYYLEELYKSI